MPQAGVAGAQPMRGEYEGCPLRAEAGRASLDLDVRAIWPIASPP
jgi:hypothetical protein